MKNIKDLYNELETRKDFRVMEKSLDGGCGIFIKGPMKGSSVIWSYAGGWEHVSINKKTTTPSWEEMCMLKDMFFSDDETVVQFHPAKENYVNISENCLHLWKPIEKYSGKMPTPPTILV